MLKAIKPIKYVVVYFTKVFDRTNCEISIAERKNPEQPIGVTSTFKKAYSMANDLNEDIIENNFKFTKEGDFSEHIVGR